MTAIGHKARAEAIAEQIRRRHGTIERHTNEVVRTERDRLPPEVAAELLAMAKTIDELKARLAALEPVKSDHARLAAHFRTVGNLILGERK